VTTEEPHEPLATVVITTHNRPEFAQRALQSALAQTTHDIEVVVVDDGSDAPFLAATEDRRVSVVRNDRSFGVCAARNTGIEHARGEWITFLDDDDVLCADMLQRSIEAAQHSGLPRPVAVMSSVVLVDPDGNELAILSPGAELRRGEHAFLEGRGGGGRVANSLVVPTDVLRAIGGFDARFGSFEHDDVGLRLNAVASIQGVAQPLYRMTTHPASRLSTSSASIPADMERTLAKHSALFARHRRAHAHFMATTGMYHLKAGNWLSAVQWCLRAVGRDPRQARVWFFATAALLGPHARRAYHWVRRPESGIPVSTLTKRRLRKYSRRLANYPRALIGEVLARITASVIRQRVVPHFAVTRSRVLLLSVYRGDNAAHVGVLVNEARARGWDIRLWALDHRTPPLASHTVGTGSGAKFPLLNRLVAGQDLEQWDWIVVADDDFVLTGGSIAELLAVAAAADLDLVQAAHTELSHRDNEITVRRPLVVARRTSYVENGPIFAVRQPWAGRVLPFGDEHLMGWGIELDWVDLMAEGAVLGIIDGIALRHLGPVGKAYAKREEADRLRQLAAARGLPSLHDLQQTLDTWRTWQRQPPWFLCPSNVAQRVLPTAETKITSSG
jgi:glycosyltransferase involved in cell wall biosynthesis